MQRLQESPGISDREAEGSAADSRTDTLTRKLCETLAARRVEDMPDAVAHEGCRGVLDWLGCALAGSAHPTIDILLRTLREIAPSPIASVFGRDLKLGLLEAAIANGQMGHVLDYDDTHLSGTTVIHPSSPILAALFGLAERQTVTGKALLLAYATGIDAGARVGATAQGHIEKGFHGTGTLGTFCAAAAAAQLLDLDGVRFTHALAIAGTQAAGMQQNRGTMCKSFHAGKAASNGILAGLLAQGGFSSSLEIVEGQLGFCRLFSDISDPEALTRDLDGQWEILRNGHKPYACGFVMHPTIDAVIEICRRVPIRPEDVERIDVLGHRHIVSVTWVQDPPTGLQAKFSTRHSAAVALIDGAAGTAQYSDARATDPVVRALRQRVHVATDDAFTKGEAEVKITAGGVVHEYRVEHASGTAGNPMTDAAIEKKFLANAEPVLGAERAAALKDLVWRLPQLGDASEINRLCA